MEKQLFSASPTHELARDLFQRHVTSVELETFSYCNRTCIYCPNSSIDRLSTNIHLDRNLFERIISDLEEVRYRNVLTLSHYNEPLSDRSIIGDISYAKAHIPDATIQIFSNGDYLDREYLELLAEAGLSAIHLSIHLASGAKYDDLKIMDRINEMSVRLKIPAKHIHYHPMRSIEASFPYKPIRIRIFEADYDNIGGDRGGLLTHVPVSKTARTSPCAYPFNSITIGYNGFVMPCCHLRADAPRHDQYRIGHLADFPFDL